MTGEWKRYERFNGDGSIRLVDGRILFRDEQGQYSTLDGELVESKEPYTFVSSAEQVVTKLEDGTFAVHNGYDNWDYYIRCIDGEGLIIVNYEADTFWTDTHSVSQTEYFLFDRNGELCSRLMLRREAGYQYRPCKIECNNCTIEYYHPKTLYFNGMVFEDVIFDTVLYGEDGTFYLMVLHPHYGEIYAITGGVAHEAFLSSEGWMDDIDDLPILVSIDMMKRDALLEFLADPRTYSFRGGWDIPVNGIPGYPTLNYETFYLKSDLLEIATDHSAMEAFLKKRGITCDVTEIHLFEAAITPFTLFVKTGDGTLYFIGVEYSEDVYTYTLYTEEDYLAAYYPYPLTIMVDGKKLETDDPFVTYGEYAELPLVAIMEALGAQLEWKYDDYVGITWGGNQCWIDTDYSSLKYGGQRFHAVMDRYSLYKGNDVTFRSDVLQSFFGVFCPGVEIRVDIEKNTVYVENKPSPPEDNDPPQEENPVLESLKYELNETGDGYRVIGLGNYSSRDVIVPDTYNGLPVTEIGNYAFRGRRIKSIVIPASVTKIGDSAFENCEKLRKVTMPIIDRVFTFSDSEFVNVREKGVFEGCSDIELTLTIGKLDKIAGSTFMDCPEFTVVHLPEGLKSIGTTAFASCESLEYINIPSTVTEIGDIAFCNCSLEAIELPDSVITIGERAFDGCSQATVIKIGSGLRQIGNNAFRGCFGRRSISVSEKNETYYSKNNCLIEKATEKLLLGCADGNIPEGVAIIGKSAFYGIAELTHLHIPSTVTSFEESAFGNCTGLKEVVLPDSVNNLGDYMFSDCTALERVKLPAGLTELNDRIFENCIRLQQIQLPDGIQTINAYAFFGCSALTEIVLPGSVTKIEIAAFSRCTSLKELVIPDSVTEMRWDAITDCTGLQTLIVGKGITSLDDNACKNLTGLKKVVLPENLTAIKKSAFDGCTSLSEITLPAGVWQIGHKAFRNCVSLQTLVIPGNVVHLQAEVFDGWTEEQTIFAMSPSAPASWNDLDYLKAKIYWVDEWEYVDGVPTPKT